MKHERSLTVQCQVEGYTVAGVLSVEHPEGCVSWVKGLEAQAHVFIEPVLPVNHPQRIRARLTEIFMSGGWRQECTG